MFVVNILWKMNFKNSQYWSLSTCVVQKTTQNNRLKIELEALHLSCNIL